MVVMAAKPSTGPNLPFPVLYVLPDRLVTVRRVDEYEISPAVRNLPYSLMGRRPQNLAAQLFDLRPSFRPAPKVDADHVQTKFDEPCEQEPVTQPQFDAALPTLLFGKSYQDVTMQGFGSACTTPEHRPPLQ